MSNKLKTLSPSQLEHFITEKVSDYIGEKCFCTVSNLDTPNIDTEADLAEEEQRTLTFEVELSYYDEDGST